MSPATVFSGPMVTLSSSSSGRSINACIVRFLMMMILCSTTSNSLQFNIFNLMPKSKAPNRISNILQLVETSNGGLNPSLNDEIISSIKDLKAAQPLRPSDNVLVNGNWESLWTTEKVPISLP